MFWLFWDLNLEQNLRKKREFLRREEEILAATERLLNLNDDNVTVDRIASEVGIGKGTIYKHFKTKHDIVAKLIELEYVSRFEGLAANERTPMDRISDYVRLRLSQPLREQHLRDWHQSLRDYQQSESLNFLQSCWDKERFRLAVLLDQMGCTSESRSPLTMAALLLSMIEGTLQVGATRLHPDLPEALPTGILQWLADSVKRGVARRVTVL